VLRSFVYLCSVRFNRSTSRTRRLIFVCVKCAYFGFTRGRARLIAVWLNDMKYTDMVIEAWYAPPDPAAPPDQRRFMVRVLSSPAGEMALEDGVPFAFDRRQLRDRLQQLERRALDRAGLIAFGRELAEWLLPSRRDADAP
jgi:hypothetical protein